MAATTLAGVAAYAVLLPAGLPAAERSAIAALHAQDLEPAQVIRHIGGVAVDPRERRVGHDPRQHVRGLVAQVEQHVGDVHAGQDRVPLGGRGLE